jgi:hypothetical protein
MAADTTTTTDGRHELRFLHAALARDAAGLVAALGDSAGAARGGRATGMANLPGTGYTARPSKVDIDGFKCLVRYGVFRSHIPPQLFATLGPPIPQSGRMQAYGSGLRYLARVNEIIHLFVPEAEYQPIVEELARQLGRCMLPSRHKNKAADTNVASVSVDALLSAMDSVGVTFVSMNAYGMKTALEIRTTRGGDQRLKLPAATYGWLSKILAGATRGSVDVGVVWESNGASGDAYLVGFGGRDQLRPKGAARVFPVGVLLQSTRQAMQYMNAHPSDPRASGFCPPESWQPGGTVEVYTSFLRSLKGAAPRQLGFHVCPLAPGKAMKIHKSGVMDCPGGGGGGGGGGDPSDVSDIDEDDNSSDDDEGDHYDFADDDADPDPPYAPPGDFGSAGAYKVFCNVSFACLLAC